MASDRTDLAPYIPNADPAVRQSMLDEIGVEDVSELFGAIPDSSRFDGQLDVPTGLSEQGVRRDIESLLSANRSTGDLVSFLGGGCWPHEVPAVVEEIIGRSEFLTAYGGRTYSDLGRLQALFEAQSMIGELVGLDAVGLSVYDWATAAGDALRMAAKLAEGDEILVPGLMAPDRLSVIQNYCESLADIKLIDHDSQTGRIDLDALQEMISERTAGVYVENPAYLGFIETNAPEISRIAHEHGALSVVGVDPISLGVLRAPGSYGADIVCGEGQPLGMRQSFGGATMGILACRDEERFLTAMPTQLIGVTETENDDELGFTWWTLPERSMYTIRDEAKSIVGSSTALWAIAAGVYLAVLGPNLAELGETIMQKAAYAREAIDDLPGFEAPVFDGPHFKEFTVRSANETVTMAEVNNRLLERDILGGEPIGDQFEGLGDFALYCVTERHAQDDIDRLVETLGGMSS